jgi:hypothetical protein
VEAAVLGVAAQAAVLGVAAQTKWANYVFPEMTFKMLTAFSGMPRYQSRRSCKVDDIGFCLFYGMPL